MKRLGFEELCFYSEVLFPLSAILFFPLALLMLFKREIVKLGFPFRLVIHYPLLVSGRYNTYVEIFSLGVKFYTNFTDGTALVSANFKTGERSSARSKFYKYASRLKIETAWIVHQGKIERFTSSGKHIRDNVCFEDYVEISTRDDAATSLLMWATNERIKHRRIKNLADWAFYIVFFSLLLRQSDKVVLGPLESFALMVGLALILWSIDEQVFIKKIKFARFLSRTIAFLGAAVLSVVLGAQGLVLSASGGLELLVIFAVLSIFC